MKVIDTANAPAAIGPYSQAISANGFIFTSGQIPVDPATGNIDAVGIQAQTEQTIKNLAAVLEAAGSGLADVVKTTCYLKDMGDFALFNNIYSRYFALRPARSCVESPDLPKGALVEIEAVALIGRQDA
ncbi:MAG: RidA family protein [Clostridia bacterium]|nr:RidA family protein [Clostridia bacterium]